MTWTEQRERGDLDKLGAELCAGVCLVGTQGELLFCDKRAAELLGPAAVVGERLAAALPGLPFDFDATSSSERGAGQSATYEHQGTSAGVVRRLRVHCTPTPARGVAATVVVQEVVEDCPLHAELRLARQTLRSLVDASPVCILTLDLQMNVTMWNPAAEALFGWSAEDVLGRPYPLVPPQERESFKVLFDRVVGGEGFTGVEGTRARRDGSMVYLRIHTAPMREASGEIVGALAMLEDLSDRRRLEQRILQAQKMEAVGRLAGGVAHDFNNLLAVILGMSELLLVRAEAHRDEVSRGLREIHECAQRARNLTSQLLAFSRQQVLRPQVTDLNELVLQSSKLLRRVVGEEVRLLLELNEQPIYVRVDHNQFDQMLINLAANARDAMPEGGSLTLRSLLVDAPPPAASGSNPNARFAALDVTDTGEGIPQDVLENIFDPFFTTKESGRGTGLGLSTVYGIAEQSGGRVEACSEVGGGSVFRVLLPLVAPPEGRSHDSESLPTEPPRGDECVLLVEDDADVRSVTARMLEELGYRVLLAENGQEARTRVLAGEAIDVVLTDLSMPVMGGRALAESLATSHPSLPVIFMSAHLDLPDLRVSVAEGRAAFLQKPASRQQLAECVRTTLDEFSKQT